MIFVGSEVKHRRGTPQEYALWHHCYMVCNDGADELHKFAEGLGLARTDALFNPIIELVVSAASVASGIVTDYYPLTQLRRALAVKRGAVELAIANPNRLVLELCRMRQQRRVPGERFFGVLTPSGRAAGASGTREILTIESEVVTVDAADLDRACRVCGVVDDSVRARSYRQYGSQGVGYLGPCGSTTCARTCASALCLGRVGVIACATCEHDRR